MNSQQLVQHIKSLTDISDIMSAMKYLSQMESNKLSRYIAHQKRVLTSIELAAEDFLQFNPHLLARVKASIHIIIVIGSERGFCGNYNKLLYESLENHLQKNEKNGLNTEIIAVGYKLQSKFEQQAGLSQEKLIETLVGPRLTEEIPTVISNLIESVSSLTKESQAVKLTVLYHSVEKVEPVYRGIFPAFRQKNKITTVYTSPPVTHLTDITLFSSLLDEYLFANLNQVFYAAFMSENSHRVRHMENALNKLADKIQKFSVKRNEIRQEEITEELEVIMLSSGVIEEAHES